MRSSCLLRCCSKLSLQETSTCALGDARTLHLVTSLFTELITNNAAAVLVFPIALATAETLGVSMMPFVVAVTVAASASFATPIGYQTNLMVYGPGGYHFTDYLRLGIPLSLMLALLASLLIPLVWQY